MGDNAVGVDAMLERIGSFGSFQGIFNGACAFMILPITYQVLVMYFLAQKSPWKCVANSSICLLNGTMPSDDNFRCTIPRREWLYTESEDFSIVTQFDIGCDREWLLELTTTIFFVGAIFGAFMLGWLGDNFGRKRTLFPSISCLILIGFMSSFLPSIEYFVACRFIVGFFYAGSFGQTWILVSEFVDSKNRPVIGMCLLFFYSFSLFMLGVKAYFIRKWKILLMACTAPYLVCLLFYKFIPESVRWMRLKGKMAAVMDVFERMARWNNTSLPPDIKVSNPSILVEKRTNIKDLFQPWQFGMKTIIQGYSWFANGLAYYGLSLAADDLGGSIYVNFILVSIMEFPAYILVCYGCTRFGRKVTTILPMFIGSIFCIIIPLFPLDGNIKVARVLLGMFGKCFITMSYSCLYIWSAEIFPTHIRACGIGFVQLLEMIGGAICPFIAKRLKIIWLPAPFIVMGSLSLVSSGLSLWLPETKGKDADEERPCNEDNLLIVNE